MSAEAPTEDAGTSSREAEGDGFHTVASLRELQAAGRKRVMVEGRAVVLFHVSGRVYALDHFCYHAGGPLELGDIEDSHGRLCVVCPWHKHTITLDTGESLYTAFDPSNPRKVKHNCSKGVKQRVHRVRVEGDSVLVKLSELSRTLDSDRYYTEEYRELTESVLREPVLRQRQQLPWGRSGAAIHSSRSGLKPFSKPKW